MNINTQICKKLTSGPKIARYSFRSYVAQGLSESKHHRPPAHLRFPDLLPQPLQQHDLFRQPLQQHDPHQRGAPTCGGRAYRRYPRYPRAARPARSSSLARTAALNAAASVIHGTCLPPIMLNGSSPFASRYTRAGRGSS